jgi:hypothetical protein
METPSLNHFSLFEDDDDRTPEERAEDERIEAANQTLWQLRMAEGWTEERDGKLMHPTDFEIWMMIDPFSRGLIFSEKLQETIKQFRPT